MEPELFYLLLKVIILFGTSSVLSLILFRIINSRLFNYIEKKYEKNSLKTEASKNKVEDSKNNNIDAKK